VNQIQLLPGIIWLLKLLSRQQWMSFLLDVLLQRCYFYFFENDNYDRLTCDYQIFLDGVPLLDLPGMLQYVSGTNGSGISSANLENEHPAQLSFSPNGSGRSFNCLDDDESPAKTLLSRIDNKLVKKVLFTFILVSHFGHDFFCVQVVIDMTQRDPTKRLSVSDYIDILSGKLSFQNIVEEFGNCKSFLESSESTSNISGNCPFPSHFDSYLYPLYLKMHWNGITPDDRISIVCEVSIYFITFSSVKPNLFRVTVNLFALLLAL
jgi:hypothetical protein